MTDDDDSRADTPSPVATDAPTDAVAAPAEQDAHPAREPEGSQGSALDPASLRQRVEAAIFASPEPVSLERLLQLLGPLGASRAELRDALDALVADCEQRGIALVQVASGWRYQVRATVLGDLPGLFAEKPQKYSRALLETLAIIAYRQPVTRGDIENVRGVSVSTTIIRTLLEREWVRVLGYRDVPGKPALYGTTRQFLDYFGLQNLSALPTLQEVQALRAGADELPLSTSEADDTEADAAAPAAAAMDAAGETTVSGPEPTPDDRAPPADPADPPQ